MRNKTLLTCTCFERNVKKLVVQTVYKREAKGRRKWTRIVAMVVVAIDLVDEFSRLLISSDPLLRV